MATESDVLKVKLIENLQISTCVTQGFVDELNNEIDSSIDELMIKLKHNPSNKDIQYKIDDLVALRDETLNRMGLCGNKEV